MNPPIKRVEFVQKYLDDIFAKDLHAKRVMSLANGALGVMTGVSLAVSMIGQSLAQARGLLSKHAIKQVDRLLSNQGIVVWDMVITHRHFRRADRDEAPDFRAPLPGSPISESMCAWIALICSA